MGNTTSDYGPRGTEAQMRPSQLRFTHDSITSQFQDGHSLDETLRQVLDGAIPVSRIPPLVVMNFQGEWFVVRGNRRLYLYGLIKEDLKVHFGCKELKT